MRLPTIPGGLQHILHQRIFKWNLNLMASSSCASGSWSKKTRGGSKHHRMNSGQNRKPFTPYQYDKVDTSQSRMESRPVPPFQFQYRRAVDSRPYSVFNKYSTFDEWAQSFVQESEKYQYKFVDAHTHLDFMYFKMKLSRSMPFAKFQEQCRSFPANCDGCVTVFCDPKEFKDPDVKVDPTIRALRNEEGVWFAFGCHPKNIDTFGPDEEKAMRKLLKYTNAVALGEIGLDYARGFDKYAEKQQEVFRSQLHMALELNLPIVIHCRDADNDCLRIMKEIVPRDHKIHLHCFTKGWSIAQRWLEAFSNLFIGLTPVISHAREAKETAENVPIDRLLLETDAPYFAPGTTHKREHVWSHPGFALFVAQMVGELQGIPVDEVLKACRENTRSMYGV